MLVILFTIQPLAVFPFSYRFIQRRFTMGTGSMPQLGNVTYIVGYVMEA